jgi:hypothetical protein
MPIPRKVKPWRGFPSVNAVHGIRGRFNRTATRNPAAGERNIVGTGAAGAVSIGTVPAGCMFVGVSIRAEQALTGTTPTVALGTTAGGADLVAAVATPGNGASAEMTLAAGANMPTTDKEIWVTLGGTVTADVGIFDILVRFYMNKD